MNQTEDKTYEIIVEELIKNWNEANDRWPYEVVAAKTLGVAYRNSDSEVKTIISNPNTESFHIILRRGKDRPFRFSSTISKEDCYKQLLQQLFSLSLTTQTTAKINQK